MHSKPNKNFSKAAFRKALLHWYRQNKRDLPWRKSSDPYAIWVSEIMLQQTQVATVIPYYEKFLKRFPSVEKLAKSEEEEVLSHWAGLGYYRRARLLHRGAKELLQKFGGKLPRNAAELKKIPGIGAYTAGAIASIAFGKAEPLVDGNVVRVLSRILALKGHAKSPALQKQIWAAAEALVDEKNPGDFNQALMELGATLCRVLAPRCEVCPISKYCNAFALKAAESFPETPPSSKTIELKRSVAICLQKDKILLVKKKESRWFQGLWALPHDYSEEEAAETSLLTFLKKNLGISLKNLQAIRPTRHGITHHRITSWAWLGESAGQLKPNSSFTEVRFFKREELQNAALPSFDRKVLQAAKILRIIKNKTNDQQMELL